MNIEDLNKKQEQLINVLKEIGEKSPLLKKEVEKLDGIANNILTPISEKMCEIDGMKCKKTLLKGGAVIVQFEDKNNGTIFFNK